MSDSSIKDFEQRVENAFPIKKWVGVPTLVAVSGGPDSVALLRAMHAAAIKLNQSSQELQNVRPDVRLIVGHVDHGIRQTSHEDAGFVRNLANELGLDFHLGESEIQPTLSSEETASEETLREYRYSQLVGIAAKTGARYVAMGHNKDDQVETILFRILRGTGVSGLAGIPQQRLANDSITVIRPLLQQSRADIVQYLEDLQQQWCVDESNADSKYTRNLIRNELLPSIEARFPAAAASLLRLGQQSKEASEFIDSQALELQKSIVSTSHEAVEIDCRQLKDQPLILIRHFLVQLWRENEWPRQAMTFGWWEKISEALREGHAPEGRAGNGVEAGSVQTLNLPGNLRFERRGQNAKISRN